jgi:hypothetical protein
MAGALMSFTRSSGSISDIMKTDHWRRNVYSRDTPVNAINGIKSHQRLGSGATTNHLTERTVLWRSKLFQEKLGRNRFMEWYMQRGSRRENCSYWNFLYGEHGLPFDWAFGWTKGKHHSLVGITICVRRR